MLFNGPSRLLLLFTWYSLSRCEFAVADDPLRFPEAALAFGLVGARAGSAILDCGPVDEYVVT
eukprot:1602313-Alexandrium_andersonii.AAC.1